MSIAELKSSGEYSRRRVRRRLIALLFCVLALLLNISNNTAKPGLRSLADIVPTPPWADVTIAGPSPRSRLGGSGQTDNLSDTNHSQTLAVGEFNDDGIQDLAISAPDAELILGSAVRKAGAVYLIFGKNDLPSVMDMAEARPGGADLTIFGVADGDRFGFAIAAADVNGDGIADLIVGAPQVSSPNSLAAGAVYVLLGSRTFGSNPVIDLTQQSADLMIHGARDHFGAAIAVGDAGGPAAAGPIADLLIGAPGSSPDSNGAAYLLFGRAEFGKSIHDIDVARAADFSITGTAKQRLGAAVAIGDFNGDGDGDLFTGAPGADRSVRSDLRGPLIVPASQAGAVFGLLSPFASGGRISTDDSGQLLTYYGANAFHHFGQNIAIGEVTGDTIADLVIAAPEAAGAWKDSTTGIIYNMDAHAGAVYVFAGSRGISPHRVDLASGEQLTAYVALGGGWTGFGLALGSYNVAGNADTIADVIIGSPGGVRDPARHNFGRGTVAVLFGGRTLAGATTRPRSPFNAAPVPEEVDVYSTSLPASNDFGFAVAAGDLNGDGSSDLIVAAPFVDAAGRVQAGQVLIWLGTTKPPGGGGGGDPTPTVRLVTPAAGEQLIGGRQAVITWSATAIEKVRSYDVLLSTDGGVSFSSSVATGLPASQTIYSWTVPSVCASNARIQVVATTISGERVAAVTEGGFAIAQAGPGIDLSRSAIDDGALSLTAAGDVFFEGLTVEISTDTSGTTFQGFSRPPKIKSGGRKLKTRGAINGKGLDQFFPDGTVRVLKLSAAPCATTVVRVQRQGNSLITVPAN